MFFYWENWRYVSKSYFKNNWPYKYVQCGLSMMSWSIHTFFVLVDPHPFYWFKMVWIDQNKKGCGSTKTSLTVHAVCFLPHFSLQVQLFFKRKKLQSYSWCSGIILILEGVSLCTCIFARYVSSFTSSGQSAKIFNI